MNPIKTLTRLLAGARASMVPAGASEATLLATLPGSPREFDFIHGRWIAHNRRLLQPLATVAIEEKWEEFEAAVECWPILGGAGNRDEFTTPHRPGYVGMAIRLFDPLTRLWSIYWLDSRVVRMDAPVVGSFNGDEGNFFGPDQFSGKPIVVRFQWLRIGSEAPRWQQAFSEDDGKTWQINWTMDFRRAQ